jgi:ABC-type transport system involved in cytochrome c biogenesis permease component
MTGLTAILRKEVKNFFNSGRGVFFIYALIAVIWSFMVFYGNGNDMIEVWMIFFAAIVASNFSGTVFISERVSGTLEVLIVSGVTRDAVLFGKVFFVAGATIIMGAVCVAMSEVWVFWLDGLDKVLLLAEWWLHRGALLYLGATVLNVAASAYLSVRMGNPRFLNFVNLFMTGVVMTVYGLASVMFGSRQTTLVLIFSALGAVFLVLARREFAGERITRPVIF